MWMPSLQETGEVCVLRIEPRLPECPLAPNKDFITACLFSNQTTGCTTSPSRTLPPSPLRSVNTLAVQFVSMSSQQVATSKHIRGPPWYNTVTMRGIQAFPAGTHTGPNSASSLDIPGARKSNSLPFAKTLHETDLLQLRYSEVSDSQRLGWESNVV